MADHPDNSVLKSGKVLKLIVRAIAYSDVPAIKRVIDSVELFPSEMLDEMISGYLSEQGNAEIWLTLDDNGPIAVAYAAPERMTDGAWNLLLIAVKSERQGQGAGQMLISHIERLLNERNQRILLVETSGLPEFQQSRRFYAFAGFSEEARIRDYYKAGEDKIVFRKTLFGKTTLSTS